MPLDAGIEAAGAAVVETQPIPEGKNAGEKKHPRRRGNEVHFSSSPRPFLAATDSAAPTAASVKDACKRTLEDSASAAAADRIFSRIYSDQLSAREE
jgi:hypothetical protein